MFRLLICWVVLCLAPGCESYGRADWKSRVGTYTYDDAVKELGPAERKETTSDGVLVAEWLLSEPRVYGTTHRYGWGWRGGWATDVESFPGSFLQLQFGPDHKLSSWKKIMK
jgi:hypothetical protein